MALPKQFEIKETVTELRKLQKSSIPMIANRLRALIEFKKKKMWVSPNEMWPLRWILSTSRWVGNPTVYCNK
jgi:hypothetical protein